ncbi:MAG TPA: hypothetical protein VFT31_15355 [Kribbella sp.]|nr:hypothetical protein [Kribbella sp.]
MEALPLAFTTGWASGISAYACVLILGLPGRFAGPASVYLAIRAIRRGRARFRAWRETRHGQVAGGRAA